MRRSVRLVQDKSIIFAHADERPDHQLEAKYNGEWVPIMVKPHSLRVVKELIAWRNREDHLFYKKHKRHLYPPYRAAHILSYATKIKIQ